MDQLGNLTRAISACTTRRYRSYLAELKKAIDEGANVAGYFAWSLLDNFEWQAAYTSKFGIVYTSTSARPSSSGTPRRQRAGSETGFRNIEDMTIDLEAVNILFTDWVAQGFIKTWTVKDDKQTINESCVPCS